MISVSINTRNRKKQLILCIKNILNNNTSERFEIIVVDQSDENNFEEITGLNKKIKYIHLNSKGAGRAKNVAIARARGNIVLFTDDDCIVSPNWIDGISKIFKNNPDVGGVFGRVLGYRPRSNAGKKCPCLFNKKLSKVLTKPTRHWLNMGFGNNMAFRKEVFTLVGGFNPSFGPGTTISSADDAEFSLRALLYNAKILYVPSVLVYHNRWLDAEKYRKQCLNYKRAEMACYGYFALLGKGKVFKNVVKRNFKNSLVKLFKYSLNVNFYSNRKKIQPVIEEIFAELIGVSLGLYVFLKYPLKKK